MMTVFSQLVAPAVPEALLALGAMALLMVGAFGGERMTGLVNGLSVLLLVVVAALIFDTPDEKAVGFGGSFVVDGFARFLKILALAGSATAIIMSIRFLHEAPTRKFEYSVLILLASVGMLVMISAVRDRGDRSRQRAVDRGRAEIFRIGGAVLGHAALWLFLDLWLYWNREFCRHRQGRDRERDRPDHRFGVPVCRALLQGVGGSVSYVDAGRL